MRIVVTLSLGASLAACGGPQSKPNGSGLGPTADRTSDASGDPRVVEDMALEGLEGASGQSVRRRPLTMGQKRSERCAAVWPLAQREATAAGLDPLLVMAIVWVESGFVADARSGAGALGLMQLMKRTGAAFGCTDRRDEVCSLRAGSALMVRLLQRFKGQALYALCAYNAGSGRVKAAFAQGQLPFNHRYAEKVFEARARLARGGCSANP